MRRALFLALASLTALSASAQLKPRPDAFPSVPESFTSKSVQMADNVDAMAAWDRYPTYETYLAMMQRWVQDYPSLCNIDTIGTSVNGRLILCMHIEGRRDAAVAKPEFFYSSTIHGDEVTGYVMMLRLIDTLLSGYGRNPQYTGLVDSVAIYINPVSNPDGTYHTDNSTVAGAVRENANGVDLNRNYPDPFVVAKATLQPENEAMIDYVGRHHFRLSANLHGGSEVMNYPWDCFRSSARPHPERAWWMDVCKRFVDTSRVYSNSHFRDVNSSGYVAGGDWYIIHGGRQDYMNYYHDCLELTMEISTRKTLDAENLPEYWRFLQHSLVNYIAEIRHLPDAQQGIDRPGQDVPLLEVFPNPASDRVIVKGVANGALLQICDLAGRVLLEQRHSKDVALDLTSLPAGVYLVRAGGAAVKLVKR